MTVLEAAKAELHDIVTALENEGHNLAVRARTALGALEAEVPAVEHEAEADVAAVAQTAATQGLVPAEAAAVAAPAPVAAPVAPAAEPTAQA